MLLVLALPSACNSLDDPDEEPGCPPGFKDCSGVCADTTNPLMGCANPECGRCPIPNAMATCDPDGACVFAHCDSGFGDCNADESDGCETPLVRDIHNCGSCGTVCDDRANTKLVDCNDSECYIGICASGFSNRDGDYENGCEHAF